MQVRKNKGHEEQRLEDSSNAPQIKSATATPSSTQTKARKMQQLIDQLVSKVPIPAK